MIQLFIFLNINFGLYMNKILLNIYVYNANKISKIQGIQKTLGIIL